MNHPATILVGWIALSCASCGSVSVEEPSIAKPAEIDYCDGAADCDDSDPCSEVWCQPVRDEPNPDGRWGVCRSQQSSNAPPGCEGSAAEPLRRPTCIALSPAVYRTYYRYCADWYPATPLASICDGSPGTTECSAFGSHQAYDGMYCCCDPIADELCGVHR